IQSVRFEKSHQDYRQSAGCCRSRRAPGKEGLALSCSVAATVEPRSPFPPSRSGERRGRNEKGSRLASFGNRGKAWFAIHLLRVQSPLLSVHDNSPWPKGGPLRRGRSVRSLDLESGPS